MARKTTEVAAESWSLRWQGGDPGNLVILLPMSFVLDTVMNFKNDENCFGVFATLDLKSGRTERLSFRAIF